ncbi:MAG: FAD binding domain-containing protein [Candidatus Riflebacteria bacterium]|nr:FAD binding domain-containing protein [Candidatus Riflebacteria bacterium]
MLQTFSYVAPDSRKDLLAILNKEGTRAKILAGGTDLMVDIRGGKIAPAFVVDIKKIADLKGVSYSATEGLSIGAVTTCIELVTDKTIVAKFPIIADAASRLGSTQLRNRATIAGNICTASPCADLSCAMLALGASVEIASMTGTRIVKLADFFTGVKTTVIKADELVTRLIVAPELVNAKFGMEKLKRIKGHDLSLASVAVVKTGTLLRVALGSCAPTPIVLPDFPANAPLASILEVAGKTIKPIDDVRASKEYRKMMIMTFIEQIILRL